VAGGIDPAAGIETVEAIHPRKPLESYFLVHAVLGEFEQAFLLKQLQGFQANGLK
jgi:predicted RNA polymerase sigma factor